MGLVRFLWDVVFHPNGGKNGGAWSEEWEQFQREPQEMGRPRNKGPISQHQLHPENRTTLHRFPTQRRRHEHDVLPFSQDFHRYSAAQYRHNSQRSSTWSCGRKHHEHHRMNEQIGGNGRHDFSNRLSVGRPLHGVNRVAPLIVVRQCQGLCCHQIHRAYQDHHRSVPVALNVRPEHSAARPTHGTYHDNIPTPGPNSAPLPALCPRLPILAPARSNFRTSAMGQPPIRNAVVRPSVAPARVPPSLPPYSDAPPAYDSIDF